MFSLFKFYQRFSVFLVEEDAKKKERKARSLSNKYVVCLISLLLFRLFENEIVAAMIPKEVDKSGEENDADRTR